jgi:hypothetical protein
MAENRTAEFTGRVLADSAAAATIVPAALGDRMTTSLAEDGEGLGTLGLPEPVLRDLAAKAGFAQVRRVEMDNPFNSIYELTR